MRITCWPISSTVLKSPHSIGHYLRELGDAKLWDALEGVRRVEYITNIQETIHAVLVALGLATNPPTVYGLEDLMVRGDALSVHGQNSEALAFYQVVANLDPSHFWAWHNIGEHFRRLNEHSRAIDPLCRALEIWPGNVWALIHLAGSLTVIGLQDGGIENEVGLRHIEKAEALFEEAANGDPQISWVWHDWGQARFELGDYTRAIELYNRAIDVDPGNAWAFNNRGRAWLAEGDKEQAMRDFEHAHELDNKIEIPVVD